MSKHSRVSSTATDSSAPPPATLPLDDNALLAALAHAYAQYRLEHGSLQGLAECEGRQVLADSLERWWTKRVARWKLESGEPGAFELTVGGERVLPIRAKLGSVGG